MSLTLQKACWRKIELRETESDYKKQTENEKEDSLLLGKKQWEQVEDNQVASLSFNPSENVLKE